MVARAREPRDGRVRDPRAGTGRRGRRHLSAGPALQLARRPRHRPAGVPGQPLHPPPRRARTPPPRARLLAASPVSPSSGAPVHEWDVVRTQRADAVLGMGGGSTMAAATARVPRPRPATAARTSHASRQLEFAFGEPPTSSTEIGAEETHAADPVPVPDATECITAEAPCWRGRPALGARAIAVGRRRRTTRASAPDYRRAPRQANGAEASGKDLRTTPTPRSPTIRLGPCSTRPPRLQPTSCEATSSSAPCRPTGGDGQAGADGALRRPGWQAAQSTHESSVARPRRGRRRGRRRDGDQLGVPPGRGRGRRPARRARPARRRVDVQGRRGSARPVLRPAEHHARRPRPRGVRPLRRAAGAGDRPAPQRLHVPADAAGRRRRLRGGRCPAERARRPDPDPGRRRSRVARARSAH